MHKSVTLLAPFAFLLTAASPAQQAAQVSITRDDWGIAHVRGKTDADAVFGMIYAQAEDDFPRIEANYLTALGRMAEAEGEKAVWQDLRARLYVSEPELKADYARSPPAMRRLMDAWAAGLNHFLATHRQVKPRVLTRFEPWMALSFTEGSIGGDIERIDLKALEEFYSAPPKLASAVVKPKDDEPRGSNGIAIAAPLAEGGKSLLLINPHTSFYFRSELQMTSDEGLDAYGAATWGQFFIYQGFNAHAGWMHTSSNVDNVDQFAEKIFPLGNGYCYRFGKLCRPLVARPITVTYRTPDGKLKSRGFTAWMTHRGPIVRAEGGRWIAFAMMDRPVEALQQSFLRTKARDLKGFLKVAGLQANSSNTTIFADDKGEVAYLHPQFVPLRNPKLDYGKAVDCSDPTADWGRLHTIKELPNVIRPRSNYVFNTNNSPWTAGGVGSLKKENYPVYMDVLGENPRGEHALALLGQSGSWTLDRLLTAAFDPAQPGFARLVPSLLAAYDALPAKDPRRSRLKAPIEQMRGWDTHWSADSVPTTLGSVWGDELWTHAKAIEQEDALALYKNIDAIPGAVKVDLFDKAVARIKRDFGRWDVPWGEVNRFQRLSSAISPDYDDSKSSIPVPFTSGRWGSLASFGASQRAGTKKWYGDNGNSFVAVVEFGKRVRARAVTAGGESGNPASPHFNDQAKRYANGDLRDVYFYPDQLIGHTERTYRPGE
ncbi:MAG: penicillin acylase family protein [Sphingomicrobium sp.]